MNAAEHAWSRAVSSRWCTTVGLAIALLLLSAHAYRTYQRVYNPSAPNNEDRGFVDFYNTVYFPVNYVLGGGNPYGPAYQADHHDKRAFPLFPPHSLLLHSPLALLPQPMSLLVYFAIEVLLLAALIVKLDQLISPRFKFGRAVWIAVALLLSPCLYSQFYLGQLTLQIVLGAWIAMSASPDRPIAGSLGLVLAAIKPQFVIPIAGMMLCRGQWKAVAIGVAVTSLLCTVALLPIVSDIGLQRFVDDVRANYFSLAGHPDIGEAVSNFRRIDLYPMIPRLLLASDPAWLKLAISSSILLIGGASVVAVHRRRGQLAESSQQTLFVATAAAVTLAWVYHSNYDGLLVFAPLVLLLRERHVSRPLRMLLMFGFLAIAYNFLALERILALLGASDPASLRWRILTSIVPLVSGGLVLVTAVASFRAATANPAKVVQQATQGSGSAEFLHLPQSASLN